MQHVGVVVVVIAVVVVLLLQLLPLAATVQRSTHFSSAICIIYYAISTTFLCLVFSIDSSSSYTFPLNPIESGSQRIGRGEWKDTSGVCRWYLYIYASFIIFRLYKVYKLIFSINRWVELDSYLLRYINITFQLITAHCI